MIDDIITKVISVEDIPAKVGGELVSLFNLVEKRLPQIFPVSGTITERKREGHKFISKI